MNILGVHHGHDASACVVIDGKMIAAISEERLTRIKNDSSFPVNAIRWCLKWADLSSTDLDTVSFAGAQLSSDMWFFFDFPVSIERTMNGAKRKLKQKIKSMGLFGGGEVRGALPRYIEKFKLRPDCKVKLIPHHLAHASSAYYTSGMADEPVLIVTMDGAGENISSALWRGKNNKIELIKKYDTTSSIGWFYGNATEAMGWRHGSDEWKMMGLAPYGESCPGALKGYYPEFNNGVLVRPHNFGSFGTWNDHGASHFHGKDSKNLSLCVEKIGRENFAAEVQRTVEEQMLSFIIPSLQSEKDRRICCAGGCFLNVKFNQRLWDTGAVDDQWIYPDPGDAGLSAGAALYAFYFGNSDCYNERVKDLYYGPEYTDDETQLILRERGLMYEKPNHLSARVAELLQKNYAVGWFQGRMEAGPRALGNRSILMSPLRAENKDLINAKVKYREAFRPFCPSLLAERRDDYLKNARDERFMITSFKVTDEKRDKIPAVVHVDGTVRPQLVYRETNSRYYDLIKEFGKRTGEELILNTSFNVKGEPIVCNPREAIKCFFDTGLEALVINSYVVLKPNIQNGQ